jgi:predicted metal-dependent HD superfamily phosphohydrolase
MKERFETLFRKLTGESKSTADYEWECLKLSYTEPKRKYHNLMHIAKCLDYFDNVCELVSVSKFDRCVIEFSLWYHDIIYEVDSFTNEEDSARYVEYMDYSFPRRFKRLVVDCIKETTHKELGTTNLSQIVCDIDLMPLSIGWNEFYINNMNIREEYSVIEDKDFYPSSAKILGAFLERDCFYQTPVINCFYEKWARQNVVRLLEEYKRKVI